MIPLPHRIRVAMGLVAVLAVATLSGCGFHGANSLKLPGTKGGGPGSGPIAVSDRIAPYLPVPIVTRTETDAAPVFDLVEDLPKSIGRVRGF